MITSETRKHETPNGGDESIIHYQNDDGEPADKSIATRAEIIELKDGKEIYRTYSEINRGG